MPALAPKPNTASPNATEAQNGDERLRAHVGEGVVAGVGLQHAEAHQDADRADVRHQQVEIAGAPDLGDAVVGRDQEERRQRHRLPHHHEGVGIVGQHHADHAGEEDVVLQAQQARRRALALAEVAGGEGRDAGRGGADHHQEEGRQAVQPQVEGQRRQADRQHGHLGAAEHRAQRHAEQQHADRAAGRKQDAGDEAEAAQREHPGQAHQQPGRDHDQHPVEMHPVARHRSVGRRGPRCAAVAAALPVAALRPPRRSRRSARTTPRGAPGSRGSVDAPPAKGVWSCRAHSRSKAAFLAGSISSVRRAVFSSMRSAYVNAMCVPCLF